MIVLTMLACQSPQSSYTNRIPDPSDGTPIAASVARTAVAGPLEPVGFGGVGGGPTPRFRARLSADVVVGSYPLVVTFDSSRSKLGPNAAVSELSFGDGDETGDLGVVAHTYLGEGAFDATLTLTDLVTGAVTSEVVAIDVSTPSCPVSATPVVWGAVDDGSLQELSGLVASRIDPLAYWVEEDSGNDPVLVALDASGATLARHAVTDPFTDFEDIAEAVDPVTGEPTLFLADIGDNGWNRGEIAISVAPEPDPHVDGDVTPLRMRLTYPDGPHNAETLLVDPLTMDLYIVTKVASGTPSVYVKRAPHDAEGPFVLEDLGDWATLPNSATGGDVSPDGTRVVVRDYTGTAHLWMRDGYGPLEDAFAASPCSVPIHSEPQGEAIGFTEDGTGLVTVSEGVGPPLYYIGL